MFYKSLLKSFYRSCLVLLLTGFCLVSIFNGYLYAATDLGAPTQSGTDVIKSQSIDRIIPSKPYDLFVVLKNGLTVLIRESHGSRVVSSQVLVKTGSIYEGQRMGGGLSHYLEHVVSGGTTTEFTEKQIKERLQAIGGAANAYTSYCTNHKADYSESHRFAFHFSHLILGESMRVSRRILP